MDMDKVFICSPYRGDVEENIRRAREYCRWMVQKYDALPIAPHLIFPQFLDDHEPVQRDMGIQMGQELLADCKLLLYFGDTITEGMKLELSSARELGIPVQHIPEAELSETEAMEMGGML